MNSDDRYANDVASSGMALMAESCPPYSSMCVNQTCVPGHKSVLLRGDGYGCPIAMERLTVLVLCPSFVIYDARALIALSLMGESSGVIKDYKRKEITSDQVYSRLYNTRRRTFT